MIFTRRTSLFLATTFAALLCVSTSFLVGNDIAEIHRSHNVRDFTSKQTLIIRRATIPTDSDFLTKVDNDNYQIENAGEEPIGKLEAEVRKFAMMSYVAFMCVTIPITLMPISILKELKLISKTRSEYLALEAGEFCASSLLNLFPFAELNIASDEIGEEHPEPTIWTINHVSALDTFLLLAADRRLRGEHKRPLKTIYWKGLDNNPICKMLFHMAGFISVDMAANGSGNPNEYDRKSFKSMLKQTKKAFEDGFDIVLFPEGQLNPTPENGLLPVFPGAFSLAKMSRRPIRFVAIHGSQKFWRENHGMDVSARDISLRLYPQGKLFQNSEDFADAFQKIVGYFGATGEDLPQAELEEYLYEK